MRLFIALNLSDKQRKQIHNLQQKLQRYLDGVKWVNPAAMHLTLKFLGEEQPERIDDLVAAMRKAAAGIIPFDCSFGGGGIFPSPQKAKILWLGLQTGNDKVKPLASGLEAALVEKGFAAELRSFTPHLTLGRARYPLATDSILKFLEEERHFITDSANVKALALYQSKLYRHGAVYTVIREITNTDL